MNFKAVKILAFIFRISVGFVFFYAGFLKLIAPAEEFAYAIETYKVINYSLSLLVANILPWVEVYMGIFIIFGLFNDILLKLAALIFGGFEILLMQALIRKLEITNCGCFGSSHSNSLYTEFSFNILWICFCLFIIYKKEYSLSLDNYLESKFKDEK
jgi:uncharacterized membrane protein YphA (DoxX/SURF4 family)